MKKTKTVKALGECTPVHSIELCWKGSQRIYYGASRSFNYKLVYYKYKRRFDIYIIDGVLYIKRSMWKRSTDYIAKGIEPSHITLCKISTLLESIKSCSPGGHWSMTYDYELNKLIEKVPLIRGYLALEAL